MFSSLDDLESLFLHLDRHGNADKLFKRLVKLMYESGCKHHFHANIPSHLKPLLKNHIVMKFSNPMENYDSGYSLIGFKLKAITVVFLVSCILMGRINH